MLNSVKIARTSRVKDQGDPDFLPANDERNGTLIIKAENITINLVVGTRNSIICGDEYFREDSESSQRSAIYVYGGTAGHTYTLNIEGEGRLALSRGGINTHVVPDATGQIIIRSGEVNVGITDFINRSGIGSVSTTNETGNLDIQITGGKVIVTISANNNFINAAGIGTGRISSQTGNLDIQITGGEITVTMSVNNNSIYAAGIGTGRISYQIGDVAIKISNDASVHVKFTNYNVQSGNTPTSFQGAGIGTGSASGYSSTIKSLTIEIIDNPNISVNMEARGGSPFLISAAIGVGYEGFYDNIIIDIKGGTISTKSSITSANGNGVSDSSSVILNGIGLSRDSTVNENSSINISGGSITIEQKAYRVYSGIGIGGSKFSKPVDFAINLNGGDINVVQTENTDLAGIGIGSGIGSDTKGIGTVIINLSGGVKVNVVGGVVSIGADDYNKNTVKVNIKKNDNVVPEVLAVAKKQAIREYNDVGENYDVILSQLDFGANRSGSNWENWDDSVKKTLQVKSADDRQVLRQIEILGGIRSVAYTLPSVSTDTDTNVFVSFVSNDSGVNGYLVQGETKNRDIVASGNHELIIAVTFEFLRPLPALRTFYDRGENLSGDNWNYIHDPTGGTLRLTGEYDFVLQNLKDGSVDTESVPIHIIVEKAASGSNITFNNLNIKRAGIAGSTDAFLSADSELIAPFVIKEATTVNIMLAEGSNNTIDGQDSQLENAGYRTAIYMHAPTASAYTLKIGRENPAATTPAPSLTTLNGGINALGVENTNISMQLKDGNYNLNALNNKYEHAIAFGSGYRSENVNSGNYNLMLETVNGNAPTTIRALGNDVAIGHNGNLSTSTTSVRGKVNLQAIAFTNENAISGKFDHSALSFTTILNKVDNWKSIVMHPYSSDELITNNFWEFNLPETSLYPAGTGQNITIAYSNPEFDTVRETSPFERMAMRIQNGNNDIQFLANSDGTGSTAAIISPNNEVSSRSNMLPTSTEVEINIPKITLETNLLGRAFITPEGEVRNVTNNSLLPLALALAGSTLDNAPGVGIDNFAKSREDFAAVNGTEIAKLLLELNINQANNGDINFDDEQAQTQTLIPRSSTPEAEDYVNIATLRGAHNDKISAVDLSVTGMFTEAASKNINGNFTNTVHLKFSLLDFAEFN